MFYASQTNRRIRDVQRRAAGGTTTLNHVKALAAALVVLSAPASATDLTNIENVSSLNGADINITDSIDLNQNNLNSPNKVDGIDLDNPGPGIQLNGNKLAANASKFVDRNGDTMTGDLDMEDNRIRGVELLSFNPDSSQQISFDSSAGKFKILDTNLPSDSDDILQSTGNGNVEIPNGNLDVDGPNKRADFGGNNDRSRIVGGSGLDIKGQNSITLQIYGGGSYSEGIQIGRAADSKIDLEGGDVKIPNGNLDMSGNKITNVKDSINIYDSGAGAEPQVNFRNIQEGHFANITADTGDLHFFASGTKGLQVNSGGNVEIPNGNLNISSDQKITFDDSGNRWIRFNGDNNRIRIDAGANWDFLTAGNDAFRSTNGAPINMNGGYIQRVGGTPAANSGAIRLGNNVDVAFRDSVDSSDVVALSVDTSNNTELPGGNVEIPNGDLSIEGNRLQEAVTQSGGFTDRFSDGAAKNWVLNGAEVVNKQLRGSNGDNHPYVKGLRIDDGYVEVYENSSSGTVPIMMRWNGEHKPNSHGVSITPVQTGEYRLEEWDNGVPSVLDSISLSSDAKRLRLSVVGDRAWAEIDTDLDGRYEETLSGELTDPEIVNSKYQKVGISDLDEGVGPFPDRTDNFTAGTMTGAPFNTRVDDLDMSGNNINNIGTSNVDAVYDSGDDRVEIRSSGQENICIGNCGA